MVLVVNMNEQNDQVAPGRLEIVREFLNTWRIPNDTRVSQDMLQATGTIARFQTRYFAGLGGPVEPEQLLHLRDDLRGVLGTGDVSVINRWLTIQPVQTMLVQDEAGIPAIYYQPAAGPCALCGAVLAIVVEAVAQKTWPRLKACLDCQWVFYDHTKNGNRVWCRMVASGPEGRSCGSISKVRRWRERQKIQMQ